MPFITKADLTTLMYAEDMDAITEGDDTKITSAITAGMGEATSYLNRYDTVVLLGRTGADRDPILLESCKAIAVWYLIAACPANQNTKDIMERATFARTWLGKVQTGKLTPLGWPPIVPEDKATFFHASSNPKRGNHF